MKLKYLGHSAFEIITNNSKILVDPFLIKSPNHDISGTTDIFVTHAHSDHLGSTIKISKKTDAVVTAIFELANYCSERGAIVNGIGLGGWQNYKWGRAIAVPSFHSSSTSDGIYGGCPCGFVFEIEGKFLYHAGDTALTQEMKTIGELYKPDYSMLPIGGHYTMNIEHCAVASRWLNTRAVIPMHYNTFDAINVDMDIFRDRIVKIGKLPFIIKIGQTIDI